MQDAYWDIIESKCVFAFCYSSALQVHLTIDLFAPFGYKNNGAKVNADQVVSERLKEHRKTGKFR